jgi:8-oxo-dGTP pyrophosphatase MutT (NUDIX family)
LDRLARVLPQYGRIAWWGLVSPRSEAGPLVVYQAAIFGERGVLLAVRADLRGWELPGGHSQPGEAGEVAVVREALEETGLEIELDGPVGDYVRTGFRPHRARVYRAHVVGGTLRPSSETPRVAWFDPHALPTTLFPWFRSPIEDALLQGPPVERHEHQGLAAIAAGMRIDLRMRWSHDRAR